MLNASQDCFVAAGKGEWTEHNESQSTDRSPLRITGLWTISDPLIFTSHLTNGKIEGYHSIQEGEWRDSCLWNGTVQNCTGTPLLGGEWVLGKYTGGVSAGTASGTGHYQSLFSRFEGQWKDGQPHGKGKEESLFPDDSAAVTGTYYGLWIHGQRVGTGLFVWPDGVVTLREYSNGVLVCERSAPVPSDQIEKMKSLYC